MSVEEVRKKLVLWGKWLHSGGGSIGYKSSALMLLRANMGGGVPLPPISDDEAMKIDRVLAKIKFHDRDLFRCVRMAYSDGMGNQKIGDALGMARQTVQRRIERAESMLVALFEEAGIP